MRGMQVGSEREGDPRPGTPGGRSMSALPSRAYQASLTIVLTKPGAHWHTFTTRTSANYKHT